MIPRDFWGSRYFLGMTIIVVLLEFCTALCSFGGLCSVRVRLMLILENRDGNV